MVREKKKKEGGGVSASASSKEAREREIERLGDEAMQMERLHSALQIKNGGNRNTW